MEAEYVGRSYSKYNRSVDLFYRYRGHEYFVTDEHDGYMETMKEKHEYEQRRIDELIAHENEQPKTATFDFDEIYEMMFGE